MKALLPFRWAVTRLDIQMLLVILATIAIFYRVETLLTDVSASTGFALVPGVMWLLGAKFVAGRTERADTQSLPE